MGDSGLNMALDALMILAITGLWVVWFFQASQRKKVENMLRDASRELKEATALLDQVMHHLDEKKNTGRTMEAQENRMRQPRDKAGVQADQAESDAVTKKHAAAQATTVMRLSREGLDEQAIAARLDMPLAQVKLMLLLQEPRHG